MDNAKTVQFAQDVAAELGPQYSATERGAGAIITDGEVSYFVRTDAYYNPRRYEVSISYPQGYYDHIRYDEKSDVHVTTTVAITRDPKATARQITRTLASPALKWTAVLNERIAASGEAFKARAKFASAIEQANPGASFDNDSKVRLNGSRHPWYGDVSMYHQADRATVELHGITAEQALAIVKLITR